MKRSIQTILFLASLTAVGCGSDASDPGTVPNNNAGANSTAGNGSSGMGTVTAGAGGASGAAGAAGGTAPGAGSGGMMMGGGGAGTGDPPVVPGGVMGPIAAGDLTGTNLVWGPGTIVLGGAVTVPAGMTLTINRGTHVQGAFPVTVAGTFKCNGIATEPVDFFPGSIVLNGGSHTLQFCIVNSSAATAIDLNGAVLTASHLQIQSFLTNGVHVHGAGASLKLNFGTIGSKSTLFTGDMPGKEAVGVQIDADAAMGSSSITNSVLGFLNNATNTGLKIVGTSNTHLAYDNITGTGSVMMTTDTPVAILTKEPRIADIPNLDHNLAFFSPDLDQADPMADFSQEPQPNGGRANLGYHGGTSLARITTVHVLSPNGCESLTAGMNAVNWQSSPNTGGKTLELSNDTGTNWMPLTKIAAGADTGTTQVMLTTVTDQAMIRISQDNDAANIKDTSDRVFAVGKAKNAAACANLRPACTTNCKPFKVICYTGYRDGQMPTGLPGANEPTAAQVEQDLTLLKPLTHGIRTYGSNPLLHDGGSVPGIADKLGLDLHMGVWIDQKYTDEVNMKALNDSIAIVKANHPSIKTLIISNEYLLRVRQDHGDTVAAEARLVGYLKYVHTQLQGMNIPIVIGESYPDWLNASQALYDNVDIVMWHVHPWWQQALISNAANSAQTAHEAVLNKMKGYGITKPEKLAETGFPWGETTGAAVGSEANQSTYLHDLNQYSLKVNLEYFFFEGFDEAWKSAEGAVGGKWGMFTAARTPHPIITNINTLIPTAEGWTK